MPTDFSGAAQHHRRTSNRNGKTMNKLPQITFAFIVWASCSMGGVLLVLVLMATWYQHREPRKVLEMS